MLAIAFCGMGVIYAIYSLGFGFGLSFDDEPNLRGLASVVDRESAGLFVFGGSAGPLGRPLSLLSFLIDLPNWPDAPGALMRTNTLLHQINILLVLWLAYILAPFIPVPAERRMSFAALTGLLWGASPLLLSSSLMVVQRMNLLSATFTLLGLIGFLKGVALIQRSRSMPGLILAGAALAAATGFGILAKENAILLPAFALCLAACFLDASRDDIAPVILPTWWRVPFLYAPVLFVLGCLFFYWWPKDGLYPGRDFDLMQRLITEARILFRYLHMLVLPARSGIGPYPDGYVVSQDLLDPATGLISVLAWSVIIPVALWCRHSKFRLLRFAVLWFIAGHLLESTVIGLELYFEHRNYLPAVGVWIAVAGWAVTTRLPRALLYALLIIVCGAQLVVLFESARLWSDRETASAVWAHENPGSQRALMFRSAELAKLGDVDGIVRLVQDADPNLARKPDFLFHKLDVYCSFLPVADVRVVVDRLREQLRSMPAGHFSGIILRSIARRVDDGTCRGITQDEVRQFFETMSIAGRQFSPTLRAFAHQYLLDYWIGERRLDESMQHAKLLFKLAPRVETAELMVDLLLSAQLYDEAQELIPWFRLSVPSRPLVRAYWLENLNRMEEKIEADRESR